MGVEERTGKIVAVDRTDLTEPMWGGMTLRYATDEEIAPDAFRHAPRSIAEHTAIPMRLTPYGPARMFGKIPQTKPPRKETWDAYTRLREQYGVHTANRIMAAGGKQIKAAPKPGLILPNGQTGRHRGDN